MVDNVSVADADPAFEPAADSAAESAWALPLLALGLGLVACGVVIPEADANRQLADEKGRLVAEVESLQRQTELNAEFLERVHTDSELAQRLVQRQTRPGPEDDVRVIAAGPSDGKVGGVGVSFEMSPFALLSAETVVAAPPSPPIGGRLPDWCRHPRLRLIVLGLGLFACLFALLSGASGQRTLQE